MYMCVRGIDSVSTNMQLNFGNVPTVWYLMRLILSEKCLDRSAASLRQILSHKVVSGTTRYPWGPTQPVIYTD